MQLKNGRKIEPCQQLHSVPLLRPGSTSCHVYDTNKTTNSYTRNELGTPGSRRTIRHNPTPARTSLKKDTVTSFMCTVQQHAQHSTISTLTQINYLALCTDAKIMVCRKSFDISNPLDYAWTLLYDCTCSPETLWLCLTVDVS
jgi:hypothetical protein